MTGALAGALVNPTPGAEINLTEPSGSTGPYWADLHLTGTTPGGRPLVIAAAPTRLEAEPQKAPAAPPPSVVPQPTSKEKSPSFFSLLKKSRRHLLSVVLIILGLAVVFTAGLLLIRQHLQARDTVEEEEGIVDSSSRKNILRLKAQVETLTKEKGQLQMALEERDRQISQFKKEKADLEAAVERLSEKSQVSMRSLEDLEKKLEETERESKAVQE